MGRCSTRYSEDSLQNPFYRLFSKVAASDRETGPEGRLFSTWFDISEAQRDLAAQHLKTLFSKCQKVTPPETPEQFIAARVFQTFFFRGNAPELHSHMLLRKFQDGFRAYKPDLPNVNFGSFSEDCKVGLVAFLDEKDVVRKWDGSIEPNAVQATAVRVDLKYHNSGGTHIAPDHTITSSDLLVVTIPITGSKAAKYLYKYGNSPEWQGGAFPLGRVNPYTGVVEGDRLSFSYNGSRAANCCRSLEINFREMPSVVAVLMMAP